MNFDKIRENAKETATEEIARLLFIQGKTINPFLKARSLTEFYADFDVKDVVKALRKLRASQAKM